jgi:hypothetical protein
MEFDLTTQEYTEKVDMRLLDAVIDYATAQKEDDKIMNRLWQIRAEAKKGNGQFKVKYTKKYDFGRVYPFKALSLSQISRPLRHTLCVNNYYDIDMVNAQPAILFNICLQNDIHCPMLADYVKNRNKRLLDVMAHYGVNKDIAKSAFIGPMNGGSIDAWQKTNAPTKMTLPYLKQYEEEMKKSIIKQLVNHPNNKKIYKQALKMNEEKIKAGKKEFDNPEGTFMSQLLGENERTVLQIMVKYITDTYKTNELILCHDGLMIPKHILGDETIDSLTNKLQNVIGETYGDKGQLKNLDIKNKAMNEALDIKPIEKTETVMAGMDYETLKEQLEKDNGLFYCRCDKKYYRKMLSRGLINYVSHTSGEMSNALAGFKVIITINGLQKITPFFSKWNQDSNRREINEFVYDVNPDYVEKDDEINLWEGFAIEKVPRVEFSEEMKSSIDSTFNSYFTALGNGNEKVKTYFIHWIAHMLQKPHILLPSVPYLQSSVGGSGKSTFCDIIGHLMGDRDRYTMKSSGFSQLNPKDGFNGHLKHLFLYCAEELEYEDGKKNINYLKAHTTNPTLNINDKGISKLNIANKLRIMITTNGLNTIPVETGQRRLVITEISLELMKDKEFFERLYGFLNNKEVMRYLYDQFMNIDLTEWDHKDIPETTLMSSLKEVNRELLEVFIDENIGMLYNNEDKDGISATELLNKVNKWLDKGNYKFSYNSTKLGLVISNNKLASAIFEKKPRSSKGVFYKINKDYIKENYKFDNDDNDDNLDECLIDEETKD